MFSALNGDSVDSNAPITELSPEKSKSNNNHEKSWTDPGKQNSEEENENNNGLYKIVVCKKNNF